MLRHCGLRARGSARQHLLSSMLQAYGGSGAKGMGRGSRFASALTLDQARQDTLADISAAKPFAEIPGPKTLPYIGSLYRMPMALLRGKDNLQQQCADFNKYGKIWKDTLGTTTLLYMIDVEAVEKMHRLDGKYPKRISIDAWAAWREERGLSKGILIENEGERWRRMRTQLDKQMMRPRQVATYADEFNEVTSDFIQRLRKIRSPDSTIANMDKELFGWSLETIGTVLYELRFGNFNDVKDPEILQFISAVQDMFISTEKVVFFPPKITKILFRKWYDMHWNAWDVIFNKGKQLIDRKLEEIDERLSRGEEVSGFLSALLATQVLSRPEIYANVSELMTAAVDTTSNTMQWVIELLSRHPQIQQRLHEEVIALLPQGQYANYQDIQNLPFLRAVTKEILRLYPIIGAVTKIIQEDVVLGGYHIPKGTTTISNTYLMGRDPEQYEDPLSFKPERWLRDANNKRAQTINAFAWLPFGHGPRMCVGRRIAELEMHILLARLSQEFRMVPVEKEIRRVTSRGLLMPHEPVNVQYIDR